MAMKTYAYFAANGLKEYIPSVEMYNYGYRFYSPGMRRWINRDPISESGGLNVYAFVGNNPVNFADPYGLDAFNDISNFAAGAGDSLTFGATDWVRGQLPGDVNDVVNYDSGAYIGGEVTEVVIELGATGGAAGLKHAAEGASRSAARNAFRRMTKDVVRDGKQLHHLNPLFGHPGGAKALFPTGGLPAAIHSHPFNLKLLDRAAHTRAHRWIRTLERGWSKAVNLPLTIARAGADLLRKWHRKGNMQCPR